MRSDRSLDEKINCFMKNLILIIAAFCYFFPIFIKYLPVPVDRILQLFGLTIFFLSPRFAQRTLLNKRVISVILINLVVVILAFLAMFNRSSRIDTYLFIQTLDIYFYFFSALLIVFLIAQRYGKSFSIVKVFDLIVFLFILQAIVSIIFFISSTIFEFYLSILNEKVNQGLFERTNLLNKRFIGWGSAFFSGVVKYGFVFLIMIVLPYCKNSYFYNKRIRYILALSLITIAGIMTGRFFFLAIGLGLLLTVAIDKRNFFRIIYRGIPIVLIAFLFFYAAGIHFLGPERFKIVFGFVFELFITYFESGELYTSSSAATLEMYRFPESLSTWLVGDGKMVADVGGGYYMGSDVGYIRLIFYFGIIATFIYFLMQFALYKVLIKNTTNIAIKKTFLFMFFWVLVYHGKGLVFSNEFLVIFLLATITEKRFTWKARENPARLAQ